MLNKCNQDKVWLLCDLEHVAKKLEEQAQSDADESGHPLCGKLYQELATDLERYMEKLRVAVEGLSKEGKFN